MISQVKVVTDLEKGSKGAVKMNQAKIYRAGLDIGSTTAKMAVLDEEDRLIFSAYERHHAQVYQKALDFLYQIAKQFPGCRLDLKLTGSAALGTSGNTGLPFVQEVIAAHKVVREKYPGVNTAMDIGGEDSKMIFFESGRAPDIRMNGSCAGGTGAFIDQMATLMEITPQQLNDLARDHSRLYPVASRCGVFAKTDVQNMFSRNIPHSDIAASIFHAVILQCINSLARGREIQPKILLCGGVFTFLPELVRMLAQVLGFSASDVVLPEHSELIPAMGSALTQKDGFPPMLLQDLIARFETAAGNNEEVTERIAPLFDSPAHFEDWKENAAIVPVPVKALEDYAGTHCFLGIDSGSTTTKITILGESKEILFSWYETNGGTPVKTVIRGLSEFRSALQARGRGDLKIICSAVTGYGEDLIRSALGLDIGIVETMAHLEAARFVDPDVSFILDIGGQDMKAMFVENGMINRIEVNEACSSGCGSFLQTLAGSLNYTITEFAEMACRADAPCDLGTRCTVFMNSKIKQALRENAGVENISAGLSASVIKNCLFKVLKLASMDVLGDHIVLQGGTFKNPSIVRALEQLTGKQVSVTRIPELMGAYGAALNAHDHFSRFGRKRLCRAGPGPDRNRPGCAHSGTAVQGLRKPVPHHAVQFSRRPDLLFREQMRKTLSCKRAAEEIRVQFHHIQVRCDF